MWIPISSSAQRPTYKFTLTAYGEMEIVLLLFTS